MGIISPHFHVWAKKGIFLGGNKVGTGTSCNNFPIGAVAINTALNIPDAPFGNHRGIIETRISGGFTGTSAQFKYQIAIDQENNAQYMRIFWSDTWSNWQRFDNFGCNDLSSLASALGVPNVIKASAYSLGNTGSVYTTDISFGGNTSYWGKMVLALMNSHAGNSILYAIAYDQADSSKLKVTTLAESSESIANRFSFSLDADNFLVVTCNGGGGGNRMYTLGVLPIGVAELLCAIGTIAFGFGGWDYLLSAVAGAAVGAASNGLYDWELVSNLIDKLYDLFGHKKQLG